MGTVLVALGQFIFFQSCFKVVREGLLDVSLHFVYLLDNVIEQVRGSSFSCFLQGLEGRNEQLELPVRLQSCFVRFAELRDAFGAASSLAYVPSTA